MTTSVTKLFHNTTSKLQDQDQDRFFWSQTGLVLRPTVSDYITGIGACAWFIARFQLIRVVVWLWHSVNARTSIDDTARR